MKRVKRFKQLCLAVALAVSCVSLGGARNTLVARAETESVNVYADVDGEYTVTIPKEIVLELQEDGAHQGSYTVDVNGIIPKNSYVSVVPESEISLHSDGRDDVQCDVTQQIVKFNSTASDADLTGVTDTVKIDNNAIEANGLIRTKDGQYLASGHWAGVLNFEINLVSVDAGATISGGDAEVTE